MQISVKIDGIENIKKYFDDKNRQVIQAGQIVINEHMNKILNMAKSKIKHISHETEQSLKAKIDGVGKTYVVAHIGTLGASKNAAIRANSLEYGHAFPARGKDTIGKTAWKSGGNQKDVAPKAFIRPSLEEDRRQYKRDMEKEIFRVMGG